MIAIYFRPRFGLSPHKTIFNPRNYQLELGFLNRTKKRYFLIYQQIAQNYLHYSECLSNPLYATQTINPEIKDISQSR